MRPGPIFQQLVRLSVVQGGKLGRKTVVTSLFLFLFQMADSGVLIRVLAVAACVETKDVLTTSAADIKLK